MKEVVYSKTAQKALMRIPRNWATRIHGKVKEYASNPASLAKNVKVLKGREGVLRLRVGNWRVLMCDGVVLEILDVKTRSGAYRE